MSLLARAWIGAARIKRRLGRPTREEGVERRKDWVRSHARGRSFADIGGLYGIGGEIAFLAEEAGATKVSEFDAGDAVLSSFEETRLARNSGVRFVQGDLEDPVAIARLGSHDVVWCIGLIYHTPNPVLQLLHLRRLTRELLYLGSHTIPEVPGLPNACVYYPYVPDGTREAFSGAHWQPENCWAIGTPFNDTPMFGHGNFWWGLTASAVRAMLGTARFEVLEEIRNHSTPFMTDFVARPVDRAPILPPVSYYRERGEVRERGEIPSEFGTFYDEHPHLWRPPPDS